MHGALTRLPVLAGAASFSDSEAALQLVAIRLDTWAEELDIDLHPQAWVCFEREYRRRHLSYGGAPHFKILEN